MFLDENAREYFLLYSHLGKHIKKVTNSINIIKEFLTICKNPYLSWSTGKDSTCALSLLRLVNENIDVIHFDLGVELPNTEEYKKNFKDIKTLKAKPSLLEVMQEYGWESKECRKANFIDKLLEGTDYDGHIMGLRYDESKERGFLWERGPIYKKSNGIWVCNPIYNWNLEDVFAYLVSSDIPIHPHYYIKSNQPLEHRRVGGYVAGRNRGATVGRFYWFKEQYPEEFNKLAKQFQEVNKYV